MIRKLRTRYWYSEKGEGRPGWKPDGPRYVVDGQRDGKAVARVPLDRAGTAREKRGLVAQLPAFSAANQYRGVPDIERETDSLTQQPTRIKLVLHSVALLWLKNLNHLAGTMFLSGC